MATAPTTQMSKTITSQRNCCAERRPSRRICPASQRAAPPKANAPNQTCQQTCCTTAGNAHLHAGLCYDLSYIDNHPRWNSRKQQHTDKMLRAPTASSSQMYCYVLLLSPPMPPQHRGAHRRTTSSDDIHDTVGRHPQLRRATCKRHKSLHPCLEGEALRARRSHPSSVGSR